MSHGLFSNKVWRRLATAAAVAASALLLAGPTAVRGDGIAIGMAIDIVRVDTYFIPPNSTLTVATPSSSAVSTTPPANNNNTTFVYTDDQGSNGPGKTGTWTILKQYVAQNETVRVIPGTPMSMVPDSGVRGQLVDVGGLCTLPNISFPSPLGFPYIPVIYHVDDAHLNTYTTHVVEICSLEKKLQLLQQLILMGSGHPTNDNASTDGISAAIFVSPGLPNINGSSTPMYLPTNMPNLWANMGIPGWLMEERSGLALIDLIDRNTRMHSTPTKATGKYKRHFHASFSSAIHKRQDDTTVVLGTMFGPNSPIYSLSPASSSDNPYKQPFMISLVVVLILLVVGLGYFLWRGARRGVSSRPVWSGLGETVQLTCRFSQYWGVSRRPVFFELAARNAHKNEVLIEEELEELPVRVFGSGKKPAVQKSKSTEPTEPADLESVQVAAPAPRVLPSSSTATLCEPEEVDLGAPGVTVNIDSSRNSTELGTSNDSTPVASSSTSLAIPSRPPSPSPTLATMNPPSCPICLELFETGDTLRTLRCGHELHTACVDPWLLGRSGRCPVCRADNRNPQRVEADRAAAEQPAAEEEGSGEPGTPTAEATGTTTTGVPEPAPAEEPTARPPGPTGPVARVRGFFRQRFAPSTDEEARAVPPASETVVITMRER